MAGGRLISVEGHSFRTEREFQVYQGLKKQVKDGRVIELEVLPSYPLTINQVEIGTYQPTFRFIDTMEGNERFIQIVTSSNHLRDFKIKVFEAIYSVKVESWA